MKHLLLVSLILLCSCYSGSSKKGQKDKRDSICLQKELYALHKYVDSITLNGEPYTKNTISHEDIVKGGTLVYKMK